MTRSVRALWLFLLLCLPFSAQTQEYREHGVSAAISIAELPPEARETLERIRRGGPFPYVRDGVVFGNHERVLPGKPRGHYHEYTVKTPGVKHRGARRIVCGVIPECYYTADHYRTFRRIEGGWQ